jgi:hypothetical protein
MKNGFFAYSSTPESCSEPIERAIGEINRGGVVNITSWKSLDVNGDFIINNVLKSIKQADFFCADLTGLNDNVLFEIGYAIGIEKPIWLIFDTSHIESVRRYREIDFFSTIGYSSYSKTANIVHKFYTDKPHLGDAAIKKLSKNIDQIDTDIPLLFLKNQVETNYNEAIERSLEEHNFPCIIDDAVEIKTQTVSWYLSKLLKISVLLAEFSTTERAGYEIQNSKCSFVCGLALGLDLKILMVSESPYETPLDFKDLLKKHKNIDECKTNIKDFLLEVQHNYFSIKRRKSEYDKTVKELNKLQKVSFGECLAEHESDKIFDYYIQTVQVSNLAKNDYNVIIGRKGSGKTATLYFLKHYLESDKRNHVCSIKPISSELEGLLYELSNAPDSFEKSYLVESAWKFIIYTEIAKSIFEMLQNKNAYAIDDTEQQFIDFIESNDEIFFSNFYERIEARIKQFNTLGQGKKNFKIRAAEIFHTNFLPKIRDHILNIFDKNIYVLIDNLDKSWKKESQIEYQSKWILGLLCITETIMNEFGKRKNAKFEFHLTIFLRSDIFKYILKYAREPDKINYVNLNFEDKGILFRIIEERFAKLSLNDDIVPNDLWDKYLPLNIGGVDIKSYIYSKIIPRPRDMIFFFNKIKEIAIMRGHTRFHKEDLEKAYEIYSDWVFSSILVENGITIKQIEDFMYELVGESMVLTEDDIISKASNVDIILKDECHIDKFIDHLVTLSVLGRETEDNQFSFKYDFENDRRNKILAKKLGTKRYQINNALVPALGCK